MPCLSALEGRVETTIARTVRGNGSLRVSRHLQIAGHFFVPLIKSVEMMVKANEPL